MGIYLNPKGENFKSDLSAPIYVDKTGMIAVINHFIDTGNKYICVSRPRRFGKTMAGNMLSAYYSKGCDARSLFEPYKIASDASFEEKLGKYNVIHIDINSEYQNIANKDNLIKRITEKIKAELQKTFSDISIENDDSLAESLLAVYSETGETFIIIIDEYDVLVREQVSASLFDEYLSFLNGLFKSNTIRPAISLAYLTGILPIVREKVQSKLNNFQEYTIFDARELTEYMGFTSDEVEALCRQYNMDFAECRSWYDGYRRHGYEIYNPKSVVEAVTTGRCSNYWGKTSSYHAISDRIEHNFNETKDDIIRMLSGEEIAVDVNGYMNTMTDFVNKDDIFTYLIHLGYLVYNPDTLTCSIPNHEVSLEWQRVVARLSDYSATDSIIKASKELLEETISGNELFVARALDISHIHVTSNRSYNNEDALQSSIYLSYIYALNKYTVIREMTTGKGFADVVYIPLYKDDPALIIELKQNKTAESAINQIYEKKYFDSLSHYKGNLIFVGINYDENNKTHTCRIEKFVCS